MNLYILKNTFRTSTWIKKNTVLLKIKILHNKDGERWALVIIVNNFFVYVHCDTKKDFLGMVALTMFNFQNI